MPLQIECPNCQATLEIPDNALGGQVQCPSCTGLISVSAEPEAAESSGQKKGKKKGKLKDKRRREEEERRQKREKAKQIRMWIFIGVGVLVVIGIIGAALLIRRGVAKIQDDSRVNGENYGLVEVGGQSLDEVEKILGSGHVASSSEVKEIINSGDPPDAPGVFENGASNRTAYVWRNGKTRILLVFDKPPEKGGKTMAARFIILGGDEPAKK